MSIIRCDKGLHFFDNEKSDTCPYCLRQQERQQNGSIQDQVTVAMSPEKKTEIEEYIQQVQKERVDANDYGRTIGFFSPINGNDFVTGWLVCTAGPERGRDYRLHHGFNHIGRSMNMDVFIPGDPAITRDTHFSIVYDAKTNRFFAVPGKGTITYVNDELLEGHRALTTGDTLQLGDSYFEFIAYCREGHSW